MEDITLKAAVDPSKIVLDVPLVLDEDGPGVFAKVVDAVMFNDTGGCELGVGVSSVSVLVLTSITETFRQMTSSAI